MMDKTKRLAQLRNLCKQLFPEDNIGLTISRLMELLVESNHNEVYYKDVVMVKRVDVIYYQFVKWHMVVILTHLLSSIRTSSRLRKTSAIT